jgi:hypothetical protein
MPKGNPRQRSGDAEAYSLQEFCDVHRISKAMFKKLRGQGLAPRVMRVGNRILISKESAAEWRRAREQ